MVMRIEPQFRGALLWSGLVGALSISGCAVQEEPGATTEGVTTEALGVATLTPR